MLKIRYVFVTPTIDGWALAVGSLDPSAALGPLRLLPRHAPDPERLPSVWESKALTAIHPTEANGFG
jgi:hypothetical protein